MSQSNGTQESIDTLSGLLEAIKTGNETDFDVASLPNLLAKLDSANNAAEGLEGRLDALLAELDGLLEGLEQNQPEQSTEQVKEKH